MPMHPALSRLDHRPWPIPNGPWTMRQSWCDLLFAHWPVPAADLRHLVPAPLKIQEYDGTSWVGVVPFRMEDVMARGLPALPWISAFPELNLRLYVEYEGKPGVWFLSLDATNPLAVWTARNLFHLPYEHARMSITENNGTFAYLSERKVAPAVNFEATYAPIGEPYEAQPDTLEHWLTERYCLYAYSKSGKLFRADVQHQPWPLQKAETTILQNDVMTPHGVALNGEPVLLHFAKRLDVVVWLPQRIG